MSKLTLRELPVVTKDEALCRTSKDTRMLLLRMIEEEVECIPMESSSGKSVSFVTATDGKGYTITYTTEEIGSGKSDFVRIDFAHLERNKVFDQPPREYQQYRITFWGSTEAFIDVFEFAWLLSKYGIEVVGKADYQYVLFVQVRCRSDLFDFIRAVRRTCNADVFKCVEGAGRYAYEQIEL